MKDGDAGVVPGGKTVEDGSGGTPTVDRHNAAAGRAAHAQDFVEHSTLDIPGVLEFRASVQSYLADVPGLREQFLEKREFALALLRDLRMETDGCPDTRGV